MLQIGHKGLFEVKFCVVKCLANVYIECFISGLLLFLYLCFKG